MTRDHADVNNLSSTVLLAKRFDSRKRAVLAGTVCNWH
jgi:hypothetical protein